jgi:D-3-phosphoglycerate dehydrogenase
LHSAAQTREAVIKMAQMCVKGCLAVAEGKKWPYVADKSVYEHEKWKGADWAEV